MEANVRTTESYDTLLSLVSLLYQAPGDLDTWGTFLTRLGETFDSTGVAFVEVSRTNRGSSALLTAHLDPAAVLEYGSQWGAHDPWGTHPAWRWMRPGAVLLGDAIVPRAKLLRGIYWNEFGRRHELAQCVAGLIEDGPEALTFLSIDRGDQQKRLGQAEARLLSRLVPHVRQARQLHRRLVISEATSRTLLDSFIHVEDAVYVLDVKGCILRANDAADNLLRAHTGLSVDHGELCGNTPSACRRLRETIGEAIKVSCGEGTGTGGTVILESASGETLRVVVTPVARPGDALTGPQIGAIVMVSRSRSRTAADQFALCEAFGLTRAEGRLATLLLSGLSLRDAADRLDLQIGTVRKRIGTLFEKTGTHRQVELYAALCTVSDRR